MTQNYLLQSMMTSHISRHLMTGTIFDIIIVSIVTMLITMFFTALPDLVSKLLFWRRKYGKYRYDIGFEIFKSPGNRQTYFDEDLGSTVNLYRAMVEYLWFNKIYPETGNYFLSRRKGGDNNYEKEKKRNIIYRPNSIVKLKKDNIIIKFSIKEDTIRSNKKEDENKSEIRKFKNVTIYSNISPEHIKKFIDKVYFQYVENNYSKDKDKKSHYIYYQKMLPEKSKNNGDKIVFGKLDFTSKITFENIFFPEKNKVKKLVQDFVDNKTQFEFLSFLLHGTPGTGKSSLIKSIANLTGYHIKIIKLSSIENRDQLVKAFYDKELCIDNMNYDIVEIKKTILVIEDIDADSDIVFKREEKKEIEKKEIPSKSKFIDFEEDFMKKYFEKKMNLSDILNVIEGIMTPKGAILIITTNHPEKLDPALIRPGRISCKVHLDKMLVTEVGKMLQYHYPKFNTSLFKKIDIKDKDIRPSALKMACLACDTAEKALKEAIKIENEYDKF